MPRIPYLTDGEAGPPDLVAAIRQRRGGRLANLDRLLLRSTPIADGWGKFMGPMRRDLALDPKLRELAMCAVAVLNRAEYEWHHHAPIWRDAGASEAQLQALPRLEHDRAALAGSPLFDATEHAVLALVVQSTLDVAVDDATFAAARAALGDDRLLFELVSVTAAYNMVSRILVAFDVRPEA